MTSLILWTLITWLHLINQDTIAISPPVNVTIISENFYNLLKWSAMDDHSNNTCYTVEVRKLGELKLWKVVPGCLKISTRECDLSPMTSQNVSDINGVYWARVAADSDQNNETWVESEQLQPESQTVIGPPHLSFSCSSQKAVLVLSMPLTPIKTGDDRNMNLSEIFSDLRYVIKLYNKVLLLKKEVLCHNKEQKEIIYNFHNLRPSSNYCVTARLERSVSQGLEHAMLCCTTNSTERISMMLMLVLTVTAVTALAILCVLLYQLTCYMQQVKLIPKALAMINEDQSIDLACTDTDYTLEGDHISIVSICQNYEWKSQFTNIHHLQDDYSSYQKDNNGTYKNCWSLSADCQKPIHSESNSQVDLREGSNYPPLSVPIQDISATTESCSATIGTDFLPIIMHSDCEVSKVPHSQNLYKGSAACGALTPEQTNILKDVKSLGLLDSLVAYQSNIPLSSVKLLTYEEIDTFQGEIFDLFSSDIAHVSNLLNIDSVESQTLDDIESVTQHLLDYKSVAQEVELLPQGSDTSSVGHKSYPLLCKPIQIACTGYESHGKLLTCSFSEIKLNLPP